jgi:hypothetical protein
MNRIYYCYLSWLLLLGCTAHSNSSPLPALIAQPNSETTTLVTQAVNQLLGSTNTLLADKVFVTSSQLIIERKAHHDGRGNLLNGRVLDAATTFSLLMQQGQCLIRHNQTQQVIYLKTTNCALE